MALHLMVLLLMALLITVLLLMALLITVLLLMVLLITVLLLMALLMLMVLLITVLLITALLLMRMIIGNANGDVLDKGRQTKLKKDKLKMPFLTLPLQTHCVNQVQIKLMKQLALLHK
jgi:predicted membrane protein